MFLVKVQKTCFQYENKLQPQVDQLTKGGGVGVVDDLGSEKCWGFGYFQHSGGF